MPVMILIRGLPGAGKTTLARKIMDDAKFITTFVHIEADMFFMKDGVYTFDREKIHQAHDWCQNTARVLLENGQNVIVSNTFTTRKEIQPYIDLIKNKEDLSIVNCDKANYGSIHNVPAETLQKMKDRFEKIDGELYTSDFEESVIL